MLAGDRVALARLMTLVENRGAELPEVMSRVYARLGRAHVVGVTGPPGAGKSTLVDRMTARLRAAGRRVGIVAVDPTSPFSGGAVLGDRIRMQGHFLDPGVFIRSLASRGSHGGIARATRDVVRLLDAFGMDVVLVETVGVGQTELDVMRMADTTVVVLVPEAGDAVQVMKAGLLEIADVFVVNKADREGAERMQSELVQMLHLRPADGWQIPVLLTQASADGGTEALVAAVDRHRAAVASDAARAEREPGRREGELLDILDEEVRRRLEQGLAVSGDGTASLVADVRAGRLDPYTAALRILDDARTLGALLRRRT
jgi:LAO/AO transport system kinase